MLDFLQRLQTAPASWGGEGAERAAIEYAAASQQSIVRQYQGDPHNESRSPVRLSAIGKPAVEIATKLPAPKDELASWGFQNHPFDESMRLVFALGDFFENWVGYQLHRLGYTVHSCEPQCSGDGQHQVDFEGIKGHLDFIVTDPNGHKFVLEVKTMSTNYFQQFFDVRYNEQSMFIERFGEAGDDRRGYLTQLATYMNHTGLPGYWIAYDKGTRKLAVGSPHPEDVEDALTRASRLVKVFDKITDLESVYRLLKAPPGEPEVYRRRLTGRLKLPGYMSYWYYKDAFYDISTIKNGYGKKTEYVGEFPLDEYQDIVDADEIDPRRWLMRYTDYLTYDQAQARFA